MERHTYHKLCKARVLSLPGQIFHKDVIEPRVYDALMKYEVEITD